MSYPSDTIPQRFLIALHDSERGFQDLSSPPEEGNLRPVIEALEEVRQTLAGRFFGKHRWRST
jgi:hypothetical protein